MKSLLFLVAMAQAAAVPSGSASRPCASPYDTTIPIHVVNGKKLVVDLMAAVVSPKAGVAWKVDGLLPGYTVEFDFRVQGKIKGPFIPGKLAHPRGRYLAKVNGPIDSNPSDQKDGVWKYDIVLRQGDEVVDAIDPSIIIRE